MKVACFGELLFDHIEGVYYLGGAPTNFAGHCSKLGSEVYLITAIGNDELGRRGLAEIKRHGIKDQFITFNNHSTGTVEVILSDGIPSYDIEFSAWDHIRLAPDQFSAIRSMDFDLFYFGSLAQRTEENREILQSLISQLTFKEAFLDVNLRQEFFSTEIIKNSFKYATIVKVNDEELPVISDILYKDNLEPKDFYEKSAKEYGIKTLILTCGKAGASYYTTEKSGHIQPGNVKVIDTVGAGDSFSAGFMTALIKSNDVEKAIIFATQLADFVVSRQGALPKYPTQIINELKELEQNT